MKAVKKILCLCITALMALTAFTACDNGPKPNPNGNGSGGGDLPGVDETVMAEFDKGLDALIAGGLDYGQALSGSIPSKNTDLSVDLHTLMPTVDGSVSATRMVAQAFKQQTGISIRYSSSKPLQGETSEVSQWLTLAVSGGTMPAISFSWSRFKDRDYYMDLTGIMDLPYVFDLGTEDEDESAEEYPVWKDMFEDYLWETTDLSAVDGSIIAVPVTLNPGPATAWYYNKKVFGEIEAKVPTTWKEFTDLGKLISTTTGNNNQGDRITYTGIAPYGNQKYVGLSNWASQFSIGPSFAKAVMKQTDMDRNNDGSVSQMEQLRGVKKGYFNAAGTGITAEIAKECYRIAKEYYSLLPSGWTNIEWQHKWDSGEVGMIQNGVWQLTNERNNEAVHSQWAFGMFPPPLVSSDSSTYVEDLTYTKGPKNPAASFFYNIMKDGIKGNKTVLKNAILYLQFLTHPDYQELIVEEHGASFSAVKGGKNPAQLEEWLTLDFPVTPNCEWPTAYMVAETTQLDNLFAKWVRGDIGDTQFYTDANKYQQDGADRYIAQLGLDTSGW